MTKKTYPNKSDHVDRLRHRPELNTTQADETICLLTKNTLHLITLYFCSLSINNKYAAIFHAKCFTIIWNILTVSWNAGSINNTTCTEIDSIVIVMFITFIFFSSILEWLVVNNCLTDSYIDVFFSELAALVINKSHNC